MMTDFPLVYKKLLPFGSPPMILETPLSTCGRLANTVSTREKGHSFSLGGGKRKTVGIKCNLLLRPSREAAGGSSQPSRSRDTPRSGDARAAGKVHRGIPKRLEPHFSGSEVESYDYHHPAFPRPFRFPGPSQERPAISFYRGEVQGASDRQQRGQKEAVPPPPPPPLVMEGTATSPQSPGLSSSLSANGGNAATHLAGRASWLPFAAAAAASRATSPRRSAAGAKARQGKTRQSLASLLSSSTSCSSSGGKGERRQLQAAQSRKRSSPSSRFTPGFDHI